MNGYIFKNRISLEYPLHFMSLQKASPAILSSGGLFNICLYGWEISLMIFVFFCNSQGC